MKEHPILFSTPMVKAILRGDKTQTRRVVKGKAAVLQLQDPYFIKYCADEVLGWCPYGYPGHTLWVREKWKPNTIPVGWPAHFYADNDTFTRPDEEKWKPSIHMPRKFCRLELRITDVRIEQLHEITEEDAKAEGVERYIYSGRSSYYAYKDYLNRIPQSEDDILNAVESFQSLWHKINGEESWNNNPFVWVVTFEKLNP
jgi:hypothetical protein